MPNVFDVLSHDHDQVRNMLAKLEDGQGKQGSAAMTARKKLADKLIAEESRHEAAEEQTFWPVVRDRLPDGAGVARQATRQEQAAKKLFAKLAGLEPDDAAFDKTASQIVADCRSHIEFEETQVWPRLRKALSPREASDLGRQLTEAKKNAPDRPDAAAPARVPAARASDGGQSRAELYEEARRRGIKGRSHMRKSELARELARR